MRNGASLARPAITSIPTREGLKPSKIRVRIKREIANAIGGVTTLT